MRILQKTISILLTLQLLVSFGLYGGLCCLKTSELSASSQAVEQTAESEESLPPCHRKKAAEKPASHLTHKAHIADRTSGKNIAASVINRDCCFMKREIPEGEPLTTTVAPQTGKLVAVLATALWRDGEIVIQPPQLLNQSSSSHSPPYPGFQLSLRI